MHKVGALAQIHIVQLRSGSILPVLAPRGCVRQAELEEYNQMKTMNKEYEVEMAHLMTEIEELKRENMAMIDIEAHEALQEELDKIKVSNESRLCGPGRENPCAFR